MITRWQRLKEIERKIGIQFRDLQLLERAFIHRSFLNEARDFTLKHNEQLEFLGDAILECLITLSLVREYPSKEEGELTELRASLLSNRRLEEIAQELEIDRFILCSKGEKKNLEQGGRSRRRILASTFEALVGAIYLDQGFATTEKLIQRIFGPRIKKLGRMEIEKIRDAKSILQEMVQKKLSITPTYQVLGQRGPTYNKEWLMGVFLNEKLVGVGRGYSKQEAEIRGAKMALKREFGKVL